MRVATYSIFDDVIYNTTPVYSPAQLSARLGEYDKLAVQLVVDKISGTSPTLAAKLQTSGDGQEWLDKALALPATSLTAGQINVLSLGDAGAQTSQGLVRLELTLGGTSPRARVRARVTVRNGKRREVTPLTILGGGYWWSCDRAVVPATDGDPVDSITDQGTAGITLTSTGGNRPTFESDDGDGLPALLHNSQYLFGTAGLNIGTADFLIACVYRASDSELGTAAGIGDSSVSEHSSIRKLTTSSRFHWTTNTGEGAVDLGSAGTGWQTCVGRRVSGTMYYSINGGTESSSTTNAAGTLDAEHMAIGATPTTGIPANPLVGATREFTVYKGTVDAAQVAELHANMAARWNL